MTRAAHGESGNLRQQTVLARFGELALQSDDLDEILTEACRLVGHGLGTDLAKIMELQKDGHTLLVRAGVGWDPGVVGVVTIDVHDATSEALALKTGEPMISPDIETETRFRYPAFLTAHGVRAVANVVIIGGLGRPPFGILQIDSRKPRPFTAADTTFLRTYANLVAAAVDRLRVMGEVRDGEERLRLALEAGELGSWDLDLADGSIIASSRTLEILGQMPNAPPVSVDSFLAQVLPDDRDEVAVALRSAVYHGAEWRFECRCERSDDGVVRWIEGHSQPTGAVENAPPSRMLGVLADISVRKEAESELKSLNVELESIVAERTKALSEANAQLRAEAAERERVEETLRQMQKMEAVGQLTGGIAHDFNNLLASIDASLELIGIRTQQGRTMELSRYVETARASVQRGAALTHRLLAFSRRQTLDPKTIVINRLVSDIEGLAHQTADPAIEFSSKLAADLWVTLCDPNQLENALLNLINNACDAMPAAGRLTIETANVTLRHDRVADEPPLEGLAAGEYVTLSVTDTGSGMPPEVLRQAFEPFFTTKPLGKGTGLGLSMIHGFAKQSGGHAHIWSEVGHGTRVTILLPRHLGPVDVRGPLYVAARGSHAAHCVVLVVEDELPLRGALIEMLRDRGLTVLEADTGRNGLAVLETQPGINLLVTDVGLPGDMNGRELANAARHLVPALKVLFITGYAEGGVIADGILESGMQLMTKPFTLNKFANTVQDMIAA